MIPPGKHYPKPKIKITESGFIYCPYIPILKPPKQITNTQAILTRHGKKLLDQGAKYYSKIIIS